jgi:hypothetical protein
LRLARSARAYNAIIAAVADHRGATVVDLYAATNLLFPHPELQANAADFNTRGYAVEALVLYRVMHSHGAL